MIIFKNKNDLDKLRNLLKNGPVKFTKIKKINN
jgi:hypothetical protein